MINYDIAEMASTTNFKARKGNAEKNIFSKYCSEEWQLYLGAKQRSAEFKTGEYIFREGEVVKEIYLIEKGKIKVVSGYGENTEHILRLAGEGKLMGHRGLGAKTYSVSGIALEPTTVTVIPIDVFNRLIKANPEFSLYLIHFITSELNDSESRMKKLIHLDVRQKIADIIIMLIDAFGYKRDDPGKLTYTLSRYDFANISGTTYETVIRSLTFLQKEGYIGLEGKTIRVVNEKGLREFSRPTAVIEKGL
ncbi:MAG: Crp/Fnr family transcriptional regulator [Bacteroidia bacterium]